MRIEGTSSGSAPQAQVAPRVEGTAAPQRKEAAAPAPSAAASASLPEAVDMLNRYLRSVSQNLYFEIDAATGKTVVRVVDAETSEVVRQIPSEEVLAIARALRDSRGLLLNDAA